MNRINIVHTNINEHAPVVSELIILLVDSLEQIGFTVSQTTNLFEPEMLNIIIGHVAFVPEENYEYIKRAGFPFIVFQLEALDEREGYAKKYPKYIEFLGHAKQVWDYSLTNTKFLAERGFSNVRHIPIGYSKALEKIQHREKDVDILFYGSMNERRRNILLGFRDRRVNVQALFSVYGSARDEMIARSKIVLNLHQFETSQLEEPRISYLLNNRCFVLSETADHNPYGDGVIFSDYDKLVDCGLSYLEPNMELERNRVANAGYAALKRIPTTERIRSALEEMYDIG